MDKTEIKNAGENAARNPDAGPDIIPERDISIRRELLELMRRSDATRQMAEALVREATGGGKTTSVIKALEAVRNIIGAEFDRAPDGEIPWSELSDEELLSMIRAGGEDSG